MDLCQCSIMLTCHELLLGSTVSYLMQWAAVRTHWLEIRVPPQVCLHSPSLLYWREIYNIHVNTIKSFILLVLLVIAQTHYFLRFSTNHGFENGFVRFIRMDPYIHAALCEFGLLKATPWSDIFPLWSTAILVNFVMYACWHGTPGINK